MKFDNVFEYYKNKEKSINADITDINQMNEKKNKIKERKSKYMKFIKMHFTIISTIVCFIILSIFFSTLLILNPIILTKILYGMCISFFVVLLGILILSGIV